MMAGSATRVPVPVESPAASSFIATPNSLYHFGIACQHRRIIFSHVVWVKLDSSETCARRNISFQSSPLPERQFQKLQAISDASQSHYRRLRFHTSRQISATTGRQPPHEERIPPSPAGVDQKIREDPAITLRKPQPGTTQFSTCWVTAGRTAAGSATRVPVPVESPHASSFIAPPNSLSHFGIVSQHQSKFFSRSRMH